MSAFFVGVACVESSRSSGAIQSFSEKKKKILEKILTSSAINLLFFSTKAIGYFIYSCNERLFKINFSPQKQGVVDYTRYVSETSKLTLFLSLT